MLRQILSSLPRLLGYSFLPLQDGAYPRISLQRWLVMLAFWPLFLSYLAVTWLSLALDHLLFPGFRRLAVRQPVFVLGIPRSGTTFLHRLLAGDQPRFTTPTLAELIFAPSIVQRKFWHALILLDRALGGWGRRLVQWVEDRVFAALDDVHATRLRDPEEDYLALIPALYCFLLVVPFGDPRLLELTRFDHQASAGQKARFIRHYRGLIQRHLYYHGAHRQFLSKNPSFTPMLETLAKAFPDARFIACVRNPDRAVPSQINSILVGARLFSGKVETSWWRQQLLQMLVWYYRHLLEALPQLPAQRQLRIRMEDLVQAPDTQVLAMYQQLRMTPAADYVTWLQTQAEQSRRFQSRHQYAADRLGVSRGDLARHFDFAYRQLRYGTAE